MKNHLLLLLTLLIPTILQASAQESEQKLQQAEPIVLGVYVMNGNKQAMLKTLKCYPNTHLNSKQETITHDAKPQSATSESLRAVPSLTAEEIRLHRLYDQARRERLAAIPLATPEERERCLARAQVASDATQRNLDAYFQPEIPSTH